MKQYHDLCKHVLENGVYKSDRTGTGTYSVFGYQMRFDMKDGFPLVTTKALNVSLITSELEMFIKGETNVRFLLEKRNNIWNEWAFKKWTESSEYDGQSDMTNFSHRQKHDKSFKAEFEREMKRFKKKVLENPQFAEEHGELGAIYGRQWRSWQGANGKTYDQLKWVINEIMQNPDSRRLVVSAWNPQFAIPSTDGTIDPEQMALPPCHTLFQFNVSDNKLNLHLFQRSGDVFLGVPFNIASYSLLLHLVAKITGYEPGEFIHSFGDVHIYSNHIEQVKLQLTRNPFSLPTLMLPQQLQSIEDFNSDDIQFLDYHAHPHIKGEVAV